MSSPSQLAERMLFQINGVILHLLIDSAQFMNYHIFRFIIKVFFEDCPSFHTFVFKIYTYDKIHILGQ